MRVLIGCECSGVVRNAFRARGHEAFSCDIKPADDGSEFHLQQDVLEILNREWDLVIIHPPCTFINCAGLHWIARGRIEADGRPRYIHQQEALQFVKAIWNSRTRKLVIENPVGCINTELPFMPKPQYVQPYQFGDDASKKTGLWMRCLPSLIHTKRIQGRLVEWPRGSGKIVERWANQTDSGQNALGPSDERAALRAVTYPGIAAAMAEQWGNFR